MRISLLSATVLFAIITALTAAEPGAVPGAPKKGKDKDAQAVALTAEELAALPASLRQPRVEPATEKYRQLILKSWKAGSLTDGETASLASKFRRFERASEGAKRGSKPSKRAQGRMREAMKTLDEAIAKEAGDGAVRGGL